MRPKQAGSKLVALVAYLCLFVETAHSELHKSLFNFIVPVFA